MVLGRPPLFLRIKIHSQSTGPRHPKPKTSKIVKYENKVFVVLSELHKLFVYASSCCCHILQKGGDGSVLVALCFWLGKWKGKCNNTNWLGKKQKNQHIPNSQVWGGGNFVWIEPLRCHKLCPQKSTLLPKDWQRSIFKLMGVGV